MVQAIGSPSFGYGLGTGTSTGFLESQLNRYQAQLADWCNCPSAKTPEGKAKIQEISDKAGAVKTQLDRINAAKSRQPSGLRNTNTNSTPGASADTAATTIGSFLDVFA